MIPFAEARRLVLAAVRPMPTETVTLETADGRTLARSLRARLDLPRFDQSAMDGYAVRIGDFAGTAENRPVTLRLDGEIPAGRRPGGRLRAGRAVKVFTGSPVPAGTEAVVVKEVCEERDDRVVIHHVPAVSDHVRRRGEEIRRGAELIDGGTVVTPPVIGLLAAHGVTRVPVHRQPDVALITLGDELAAAGAPLAPGLIRDANGPALAAALHRFGVRRLRRFTLGDDPRALRRRLAREFARNQVVITVGGASVGDHDHVLAVRQALGVREAFTRVAVQPGKPCLFGRAPGGCLAFSLPGNPVSALVVWHQLVRLAFARLAGRGGDDRGHLVAELTEPLARSAGRLTWVRGVMAVEGGRLRVRPTVGQGSHMLTGLVAANALIEFPAEVSRLEAGASVRVQPLAW